jgi:hypothetical protein
LWRPVLKIVFIKIMGVSILFLNRGHTRYINHRFVPPARHKQEGHVSHFVDFPSNFKSEVRGKIDNGLIKRGDDRAGFANLTRPVS